MPEEYKVAYKAEDTNTVNDLERACETDEKGLTAEIKSLKLTTISGHDGSKATLISYTEHENFPPSVKLGDLEFVIPAAGQTDQQVIAVQTTRSLSFLFKGEAYINGDITKLLVFRKV